MADNKPMLVKNFVFPKKQYPEPFSKPELQSKYNLFRVITKLVILLQKCNIITYVIRVDESNTSVPIFDT